MSTYSAPASLVSGQLAKAADVNNVNSATSAAFALLPTNDQINRGKICFAVDTGAANAYVVASPKPATSYSDGMAVVFRPTNANTGACTINVDGLGAVSIKTNANTTPAANDILVGVAVNLRYSSVTGFFHMEGTAAGSVTAAAASAAAAAVSAAAALVSQNAALVSQNAAAASALSASTDAGTATTKASEASVSASNALGSQLAAASSAGVATVQAGIATTKASDAAASELSASGSASAASGSATTASNAALAAQAAKTGAEAALDSFDDRYLGAKAADPTLDNDGNALITGAIYFNTVINGMKVYTGSAWIVWAAAIIPVSAGGTGAATLAQFGVLVGQGTSAIQALAAASNGQVLLGVTGGNPIFATITDGDGIDTTTGAGTLTIACESASTSNKGISTLTPFLTDLLYPSVDGGLRDIHRGGWNLPLNQQWGGHLMPLPDGSWGDTATGNIANIQDFNTGAAAGANYRATRFKVGKALTVASVFLKIGKTGNPTDNVTAKLYADSSGPAGAVTNGLSGTIAGTLISSIADCAWVQFTFATPPSLSADTYYWLSFERSGSADGSNYYRNKVITPSVMPGSRVYNWNGSAWGDAGDYSMCFMVVPVSANQFLQTGGQFDGELHFTQGAPIDQSDYLTRPLKDFFNAKESTVTGLWEAPTKDKTLEDYSYGLDHDRIVLRVNATTGYAQVDLYESAGTKHTVTGTTDVSSGVHQIGWKHRAYGDGADFLYLYVDGVSEGTPVTSATITFDDNFKELGTATLGGGFPLAPTWTVETLMGSLPGADGWTYGGTSNEASHFVVSGGKLYQQIVGSTDTANYGRTTLSLNNTNGWSMLEKFSIKNALDTTMRAEHAIYAADGSKRFELFFHKTFIDLCLDGSSAIAKHQVDMTKEHSILSSIKGSDCYVWCDGKLIFDGTGLVTVASAANEIYFGDQSGTAGANAEAVIDHFKYYETAAILPQYTSGILHEHGVWSGDMSALLPILWNSGTPISIKEYCGIGKNYLNAVIRNDWRYGVVSTPTSTSTSLEAIADLSMFAFFETAEASMIADMYNTSNGEYLYGVIHSDGVSPIPTTGFIVQPFSGSKEVTVSIQGVPTKLIFGLHNVSAKWRVSSGTGGSNGKDRLLGLKEVL